ncbi:DNA recombination protein RmuC [Neolewinella xylanilytica]|uniref:DNA recombination protein RmuC n=1 Tax=Neolewinella xylanilytica TaxID=1514080 RepID=A0A2S6I5R6_9BACT|nr:DNA recombination protein RmuC [Neolewinella xylanilytica]PPK86505.1 DNA recombination protein RmuC [Neolewinella xylanilytica]
MEANTALLYFLLTGIGIIMGTLLAWLYLQSRQNRTHLEKEVVKTDYVGRELYEQLRSDADLHYENLQERIQTEAELRSRIATLTANNENLQQRLSQEKEEMERLQAVSVAQFERTAERLLQEKGDRFTKQNAVQLDGLLTPLKERIQGFEDQIQKRYLDETKERVSLRTEIRNLQELNQQISLEANNLAGALRGNTKVQGDWGEWQLLTLLEASGLQQGVHFFAQSSYTDEDGRQKRPDFIINLPDNKHLVVDSKVSLNAYERFCSCPENDLAARNVEAASHLRSLRNHVTDLASKNYTRLYQINSPDYLLLFVPIEPALGLALQTDKQLFIEALQKNIVLVTPSTLLATLRTVSYIWKQENQKKNVLEIARQSGLLYDSFVAFTDELQKIGHRLDQAQSSYQSALTKLSTGGKYGATLIGRAEKLRKLGAKAKRRIDTRLLEEE